MNDVTFQILKIVVSVCFCLITLYVIPYVNRLVQNEKLEEIIKVVNVAVKAAEQTMGSGNGPIKKDMALEYAREWLNSHAIHISGEQLNGLIEAAVYGMNAGKEA